MKKEQQRIRKIVKQSYGKAAIIFALVLAVSFSGFINNAGTRGNSSLLCLPIFNE